MAYALVQSTTIGSAGTSATTLSATLASTAAHNFLTAIVSFHDATANFTAPANWLSGVKVQAQGFTLQIFYYPDTVGGQTTFAFSSSAAANAMGLIVSEWSGMPASVVVDLTATNSNASSTTEDSGTTGTTTAATELWLAAMCYSAGSNRTLSATTNGFTLDQSCTTATDTGATHRANVADFYKVVSATGAANVSETLSSAAPWAGCIVTFKPGSVTFTATASVGGAGGASAGAQVQGRAADGGAGGSTAAVAPTAASVGGLGGSAASAQAISSAALGGRGGSTASTSAPNALTTLQIADGATAVYDLQETSGTTAHDRSGNGYDASVNGGVTLGATGPNGATAFALNGSTGYLACPAGVSVGGDTACTFEVYFNQTGAVTGTRRILANSHTDSDKLGFQMALNQGTGTGGLFDFGNGTTEYNSYWPGAFAQNVWHQYLCVMSATGHLYVYLDGVQVANATFPVSTTLVNNTYPINIGRNPAYAGDYFGGSVAFVAVYAGIALSSTQAANHYTTFQTLNNAAVVGGLGGTTTAAQVLGSAALGGLGGEQVAANSTAVAVGGAGGVVSGAGASSSAGGLGGLTSAAQGLASAPSGGLGGDAATAQAISSTALGGTGGVLPFGTAISLNTAQAGGTGGVVPNALAVGLAILGGSGGAGAGAQSLALSSVGGVGGLSTTAQGGMTAGLLGGAGGSQTSAQVQVAGSLGGAGALATAGSAVSLNTASLGGGGSLGAGAQSLGGATVGGPGGVALLARALGGGSAGGIGGALAAATAQGAALVGGLGGMSNGSSAQASSALGGAGGVGMVAVAPASSAPGGAGGLVALVLVPSAAILGGAGTLQTSAQAAATTALGGPGGAQAAALVTVLSLPGTAQIGDTSLPIASLADSARNGAGIADTALSLATITESGG